jgi:hypothetical protein
MKENYEENWFKREDITFEEVVNDFLPQFILSPNPFEHK